MMAWKLATSPMIATSARSFARSVPNSVRKPSSSGSPLARRPHEPGAMLALSVSTANALSTSVKMPSRMPVGMSRFGSTDSSAASGSCSIAR